MDKTINTKIMSIRAQQLKKNTLVTRTFRVRAMPPLYTLYLSTNHPAALYTIPV